MSLDRSIAELQSGYTLRFRNGQWYIYKGTDPLDCFLDGRDALKALHELQSAEIKSLPGIVG